MPRRFPCICTSTCMHHHAQLHVSRSKCGMVMPPIMGILVVSNGHMNPCQRIDDHPPIQVHTQSNLLPLHTWVLHAVAVCRRDPASRYDPSQNMGTMATKTLVRHPWNSSAEVSAFAPDFPAIFFCTFVALAGTLGPLCHYASDSSPRKSSSSLIRAA